MPEEPAASPPSEPPAESAAAAPPKPAAKPKPPARELPDYEQIAAWVEGAELPSLANLFNNLPLKKFDALVMQIRKDELLPQHWQVISRLAPPEDEEFDKLAEVERLRRRYRDAEIGERRAESLRVAWRELRGKRPALWTASDLFAAMRRIIDKKRQIDFHDLLSGARDVWTDLTLPHGREQLEVLWACLGFARKKTKK